MNRYETRANLIYDNSTRSFFHATIVDTYYPARHARHVVAQCYDIDDAERICCALNAPNNATVRA
jgi:hypothetical protein